MLSFRFVRHSVRMVWDNRANVARIAGPLIVTTLGLQLIMYYGFDVNVLNNEDVGVSETPGVLIPVVLLNVLNGLAALWVYVGWHRFVLLEEYPTGYWASVPADRILAYFGISCLFGFVTVGLSMLVGFAVAAIGGAFSVGTVEGSSSDEIRLILVILVVLLVVLPLSARLSVALPAAAIGRPIGIRGAWVATKGASVTCGVGTFLMFLAVLVVVIPVGIFTEFLPAPFSFLVALPFSLFGIFVGVSYMTTLYGYYVERREIS